MSIVSNFTAVSQNFKDDRWWTARKPEPAVLMDTVFSADVSTADAMAALRAEVEQMERDQDLLEMKLLADSEMVSYLHHLNSIE